MKKFIIYTLLSLHPLIQAQELESIFIQGLRL